MKEINFNNEKIYQLFIKSRKRKIVLVHSAEFVPPSVVRVAYCKSTSRGEGGRGSCTSCGGARGRRARGAGPGVTESPDDYIPYGARGRF